MALKDLTDKILDEAREEAERIRTNAQNEAHKIDEETKAQKTKLERTNNERLLAALTDNERRVTVSADQHVATLIGQARRQAIDNVFAATLDKLESLSDAEYEKIVKEFAKHIPAHGKATIYVPKTKDKETAHALKAAGAKGDMKSSDEFTGGFIVVDDTAEYNFSFERILADKKSQLETEVAAILFRD